MAVLVTVFGSASKYAASHPVPGANPLAQPNHVFVYGADHAFVAATLFLVAALVLVAVASALPGRQWGPVRPAARPEPVRDREPVLVAAD